MRVPTGRFETELEVRKSRFISIAVPCTSAVQAKLIVKETKTAYPDATHVVHAGVYGKNGDEFSFSDDHEPKNTAGRPMLEVLRGSLLTDILVLAIRYFGGTLLGTGGLVKAYGDCARLAVAGVPAEELIPRSAFVISIGYHLYEPVKKLLDSRQATITEEVLDTSVTFHGSLPSSAAADLPTLITNMSNGKGSVVLTSLSDA